jgi:hypothetical protein
MKIKDWWAGLPPSVQRASVGLTKAFAYSIVAIFVAYACVWAFSDKHGPPLDAARISTFIDAVLAGVLAFAMLGVFTFLASVRRPEEEKIDDRVSFLYSARNNEPSLANNYLRDQVTLLGAVAKHATFKINLLETTADKKYVKVLMRANMHIVNMMKHDAYIQSMPLKVGMTKIGDFSSDLGTVLDVKTRSYDSKGTLVSVVDFLPSPVRLTNQEHRFQMDIGLDIPPSGELSYEYTVEGWSLADDTYVFRANRFAEKMVIEVHNRCGYTVDCMPCKPDGLECVTVDNPLTVNDGSSDSYVKLGIPPSDRVAVQISLQYDGNRPGEQTMKGIDTTGG